jgi:hypothetical protein
MIISAMVSVSVPTYFINTGSRNNYAQRSRGNDYQRQGIYTACVGSRLEKPVRVQFRGFFVFTEGCVVFCGQNVMEWKHQVITPEQNTPDRGYGLDAPPTSESHMHKLYASLFKMSHFPTYEEVMKLQTENATKFNEEYEVLYYPRNHIFNKKAFSARMRLTVEPYLIDANRRASDVGKKAHCVVVGLGLGVWKLADCQTQLLLDVYAEVLREVKLEHIAEISFSWFEIQKCGGVGNGKFVIGLEKLFII